MTKINHRKEFDMATINSSPIANISGAEIITIEKTPRFFKFSSAKSVTPEPVLSEGKEEELRTGNTILAQNVLEDILKGYNIKLKDVVFSPELMAFAQGGSISYDADGKFESYNAPTAGQAAEHTRFILRIYSEEKDYDGATKSYYRFAFPGCFGSNASFSFEDGEFVSPEYTVKSRAEGGKTQLLIDCLDSMPVYLAKPADMPSNAEIGQEYIATTAMTVQGIALKAGECVIRTSEGFVKGAAL